MIRAPGSASPCSGRMMWAILPALVVEGGNPLGPDPLAHSLEQVGRLDVLGGNDVVEDDDHLLGVEDPGDAHLCEDADRAGRGEVVPHDDVRAGDDELAGLHDGLARVRGQDLLGDGQAHRGLDSTRRSKSEQPDSLTPPEGPVTMAPP